MNNSIANDLFSTMNYLNQFSATSLNTGFNATRTKSLFCSYELNSREIVHKLCDRLEYNYHVCVDRIKESGHMDEDNLGFDLFNKTELKIQESELVLIFLTKRYCRSANCKQEVNCVRKLNKKCIYIMLEDNLEDQKVDSIPLLTPDLYRINAFNKNEITGDLYLELLDSIENIFTLSPDAEETAVNNTMVTYDMLIRSLKCPICNLDYSLKDREPYFLTNCKNLICHKCLNERMMMMNEEEAAANNKNRRFRCPFDGRDHLLESIEKDANKIRILKFIHDEKKSIEMKSLLCDTKNKVKDVISNTIDKVEAAKLKVDAQVSAIIQELLTYKDGVYKRLDEYVEKLSSQMNFIKDYYNFTEIDTYLNNYEIRMNENRLKLVEIESSLNLNNTQGFMNLIREFDERKSKDNKSLDYYNKCLIKSNYILENKKINVNFVSRDKSNSNSSSSSSWINYDKLIGDCIKYESEYDTIDLSDLCFHEVREFNFNYFDYCDFESNNHLILSNYHSMNDYSSIRILNRSTFSFVKEFQFTDTPPHLSEYGSSRHLHITGLTLIKENSILCAVDTLNKQLKLLDKNYNIINEIKLDSYKLKKSNERNYSYIEYNSENKSLYLIDYTTHSILEFDNNFKLLNDITMPFTSTSNGYSYNNDEYNYWIRVLSNKIYISNKISHDVHVLDTEFRKLYNLGERLVLTFFIFSKSLPYLPLLTKNDGLCIIDTKSRKFVTKIVDERFKINKDQKLLILDKKLFTFRLFSLK